MSNKTLLVGRILEIPNFEGYFADTEGRIHSSRLRSGNTRKELKILKLRKDKYGYTVVNLSIRGKRYDHRLVHRLILETFVGKCPEGLEGCHRDGNKQNNILSNLRWDTHKNNESDKIQHGTHTKGINNGRSKLNELQVRIIRRLNNDLKQSEISDLLNIPRSTVNHIITGRTWKCLH